MDEQIYYRTGYIKPDSPSEPSQIDPAAKISPALQELLSRSRPDGKVDAVLIHVGKEDKDLSGGTDRRSIQTRMAVIKSHREFHTRILAGIFEEYRRKSGSQMDAQAIGDSVLPVARVEVSRETVMRLAEIQHVSYIMPDHEVRLIEPVSTSYAGISEREAKNGMTWGLERLEIPRMWEITRGAGINVAVLDSGVDARHIVLKDRVKKFVSITSDFRRMSHPVGFDAGDHGTHVCGTIAGGKTDEGVAIGVAPGVILAVASLPARQCTIRHLLNGFSWAIEEGADIINISLGWIPFYYRYYFAFSALMNTITRRYNVLPVVSVGNEGYGTLRFPGSADSSLSIGAIANIKFIEFPLEEDIDVASFSSGASLDHPGGINPDRVVKPDVVAPGVSVYSCVPTEGLIFRRHPYAYYDGTSMAAPHVSGVVALLMAAHPSAPISDIVGALKETASHPNRSKRPDNRWGHGLIQPLEAHKALN